MHRAIVLFSLALAACASSQEPVATRPPTTGPVTTSTSVGETTSTPPTTTSSVSTTTLPPLGGLSYQVVADLDFPIQVTALPGSPLAYIPTKAGLILVYDGSEVSDTPVLNLTDRVRNQGEQGLLAIVLAPVTESPPRLFAHYSAGNGDTVVSEFTMIDDTTADPASERVLLRLDQPAPNHNGGMLYFADDGHLYLGLGDGGGANDQFGNGQNRDTLLGGIVRISPDGEPAPVLFQYGLRNPWRFWIDEELVYIADVGQNAFEEVSVAPFTPDLNYGWPITESLHCFRPASGCDVSGLTLPVVEVPHGDSGTCSITGGIVYRGSAIPEVSGHYFYSDLCGGYLRSFRYQDGAVVDATDWTDQVGDAGRVVSFGVDGAGEMYVVTTAQVLKVVPVRG